MEDSIRADAYALKVLHEFETLGFGCVRKGKHVATYAVNTIASCRLVVIVVENK